MSDTFGQCYPVSALLTQLEPESALSCCGLARTTAPVVLELGFLSILKKPLKLEYPSYQETLANAIVAGIKRYSVYN